MNPPRPAPTGVKPTPKRVDLPGMTHGAAHAQTYLRTQVLSAPPEKLRLMLLDGAVKFARQGREGLAARDYERMYNGVSQSRDIVVELMTTVRDDVAPDLAEKVKALYGFLFRELSEVSVHKDVSRLDKIIELLEYERETWVLLMEELTKAALTRAGPEAAPGAARAVSVEA
jgi:flagellar protein FliS